MNVHVRPEIKEEYAEYLSARTAFKKWWNPERRICEGKNPIVRRFFKAEKGVWSKWRQAFGTPIPNGWGCHPELLT